MRMFYVIKTLSGFYSVEYPADALDMLMLLRANLSIQNALSQQVLIERENVDASQDLPHLRNVLFYVLRYKIIKSIIDTRKPRSGT